MIRKLWFWAGLALAVAAIAGVFRLRFDVDPLSLLPPDMPVVEGLKIYQRDFTDARELIVTVRAPDTTKAETAANALAQVFRAETNLVSSVTWQPAWRERPALAAELIAYLWLNQPPTEFSTMASRMAATNAAATLADARNELSASLSPMGMARQYDPFNLLSLPESVTSGAGVSFGAGDGLFASPDGTFRVLFVKAQPDVSNYRTCIAWMKSVRAMVQSVREHGTLPADVAIGFTGGPAFAAEISSGMEHDMTASVVLTSVIIAVLFWFFHRRLTPMLWLLTLLALILACTLALGGLLFGAIYVISLGFAGILLGLAVDYGVVHYQEAMASPNAIIPEIRSAIGPSIFWAAVTTISAFLTLNFGGLPGLAQLGSLVALGVTLSALVMLFAFLPPLFRDRMKRRLEGRASSPLLSPAPAEGRETAKSISYKSESVFATTAVLVIGSALALSTGLPRMDRTGDALRPLSSPSYAALDEIKTNLAQNHEPMWLLTRAKDEMEIARRLEAVQPLLQNAVSNHIIDSFTLPTPLWPRPDHQQANLAAAAKLLIDRENLRSAVRQSGFGSNAFVLTDAIFDTWQTASSHTGTFWPTNELSQWAMGKVAVRSSNEFLAAGFLFTTNHPSPAQLDALSQDLSRPGFILSSWDLLGPAVLQRVQQNLWKLVVPMLALVSLSLWLAFRRGMEISLSIAVLALSGLCLLAVMRLTGWSWNLLNLMALPLILGTGVDYSIFMQLALRRHAGDLAAAHRSVGRALLLCGGTAVAGFGSLALSTNGGMASLGKVCAVGIAGNMLISVLLLPVWWRRLADWRKMTLTTGSASSGPSALYRAEFWRFGLALVRTLPRSWALKLGGIFAGAYWAFAEHRRTVVIANLSPALNGDRAAAERTGRELMRNFSIKLADLLRFESGQPIEHLFGGWTGWEHFEKAQVQKRGILLVTVHLGNWEFGGPLLTQRGIHLQVVTLSEPGRGFTELRQASRARWNIETLVIGNDPFAAVEIIRRLEAGATVALLIDRPQPGTGVMVELFGRPFMASPAVAELARASGCVVLPVFVPATERGYIAHMLPAVEYRRPSLRQRDARQQLTQEIMRAFEVPIRQHLDQWYHFVPVWSNSAGAQNPNHSR